MIEESTMKIYFESKADKEIEKAQKKSELIAKKYGVSSSAVVWKGNDKFIVVKDGEEIEVDGRKVNEQIIRGKNHRRVSEPLSERNLTRAERCNRDSNKIFSYKRALDKEMKRYLVDNGVPEDEAEKLFQDDRLDYKLRELGLHDDFFDMWLSRKYGYDKSGEYYYIPESVSKRTGRSLKEYYVDDEYGTSYLCYDIEYDIQPEDLDMYDGGEEFEEERERLISKLPKKLVLEIDPDYEYGDEYDALADAIADETGWLVDSFNYKRI